MNQGIYAIKNKQTNKQYIGHSGDMEGRRRHHFSSSTNPRLKHDMLLFGKDCFEFIVLEEVEDPFMLVEREQHYLDMFADNLYNRKEKAKVNWKNKVYKI